MSAPATASPHWQADLGPVLQRAQDNDREAFRQLVVAFQARLYSLALRLTGQPADAEELAQDAILSVSEGTYDVGFNLAMGS